MEFHFGSVRTSADCRLALALHHHYHVRRDSPCENLSAQFPGIFNRQRLLCVNRRSRSNEQHTEMQKPPSAAAADYSCTAFLSVHTILNFQNIAQVSCSRGLAPVSDSRQRQAASPSRTIALHRGRARNGSVCTPRAAPRWRRIRIFQTQKPILVPESGIDTENDQRRIWYIDAALAGLQESIAQGVPVLGYWHWSLLDNSEWAQGYKPKYGLVDDNAKEIVNRFQQGNLSKLERKSRPGCDAFRVRLGEHG